ncbi:MAG: YmaF family protein [Bacteroidota bacterium]
MSHPAFPQGQTHVHEYLVTSSIDDGHFHRAAGVSGQEVLHGAGHIHELTGWTTYEDGHLHPYRFFSGPNVPVSRDAHVHYFDSATAVVDGHAHELEGATAAAEE